MTSDRSYIIRDLRKKWMAGELDSRQIERLRKIGFPFEKKGKRTSQAVICLESGKKYESIREAASVTGVSYEKLKIAVRNGYQIAGFHFYSADAPKPSDEFFKPYYGRLDLIECVESGECFDTLQEAANFVGLKNGYSIRLAINGGGMAGGYHWRFKNSADELVELKKPILRGREILCVETGKVFDSLADAAKSVDCDPSLIRDAIRRKGTCRGQHWSYADENISGLDSFPPDPRLKRVRCIETGKVFPSIKAAAAQVGIKGANISAVIAGRQKSAGGYHWEYADDKTEEEPGVVD